MAAPNSVRVKFDALRSIAFGSISGTYAAIGTKYTQPIRIIKIANNTNADMLISFDGSTDNDFVPATGFVLYDFCANNTAQGGYLEQAVGTLVYVKQVSAPSSGSVYVTVVYAV